MPTKRKVKRKGNYKGRVPGSKNKVKRPTLDLVKQIRVNEDQDHALSMLETYATVKGLRFQDCLMQAVEEYLEARRDRSNRRGSRTPEERKLLEFMGSKRK